MVAVRLFAAAEEAAGAAELEVAAADVAGLRAVLGAEHPALGEILPRCSVLVDGARTDDTEPLPAGVVVDILPPFAGG